MTPIFNRLLAARPPRRPISRGGSAESWSTALVGSYDMAWLQECVGK